MELYWSQFSNIMMATVVLMIVKIYKAPFTIVTPAMLQTHSLPQIELARRTALLRAMVLSFAFVTLILFFVLMAFPRESWLVRLANVLGMGIFLSCLWLSYSRWAQVAGPLFLFSGLVWVLYFSSIDRSGLSIRSALVTSSVTILILAAGLLLPYRLIWPAMVAMAVLAVIQISRLPITRPMPPPLYYPRVTAIIYLLILYVFTAIVTSIYVHSTRAALATLATAYAQASAMEQQKDDFLHVASHELRAPLGPLLLSSRLLERRLQRPTLDPAELGRIAQDMIKHAKRMNDMVDLLLDITRIDQQRLTLDIEPCDITAIVRDAVETQRLITRRPMVLAGLDNPIPGEADPRRLWQVVANLSANAAKYTPPDAEIVITVRLEGEPDAREWVHLEVRDTGQGIAPEALPHLFDRYYRTEDAAQQQVEGWGLGLYVCRAIVVAHGGSITVTSARGTGTTFTVRLPRFALVADEQTTDAQGDQKSTLKADPETS